VGDLDKVGNSLPRILVALISIASGPTGVAGIVVGLILVGVGTVLVMFVSQDRVTLGGVNVPLALIVVGAVCSVGFVLGRGLHRLVRSDEQGNRPEQGMVIDAEDGANPGRTHEPNVAPNPGKVTERDPVTERDKVSEQHLCGMDEAYWEGFFERAFGATELETIRDKGKVEIDLVAHSLWGHFCPLNCASASDVGGFLAAIDRMELIGAMWNERLPLRSWLTGNGSISIAFRIVIIPPVSNQASNILRWQGHEDGLDLHRNATIDGYATLFVAARLLNLHRERLSFVVRILDSRRLVMTHSYCRVGRHVAVGFYDYKGLIWGNPSMWLVTRDGGVGQLFKEQYKDLIVGELADATIPIRLEDAIDEDGGRLLGDFPAFREWVDQQLARGGWLPGGGTDPPRQSKETAA